MDFSFFTQLFDRLNLRRMDKEKAARLREVNSRIQQQDNPYLLSATGKLGAHMAETFAGIQASAQALAPFLADTVGPENIDDVREKLVQRLLQAKSLSRASLSFAAIRDEVSQPDQEGLKKMEKLFNYRMAGFRGLKTKAIQRQIAGLRILYDFTVFDFDALLKPFRKGKGYKTIKAADAVKQLEDLYYVQAGWKPDTEDLKLLRLLLSIRKKLTKNSQDELIRLWSAVEDYWMRIMPTDLLADYIRAIRKDPDYFPAAEVQKETFLEDFAKSTSDRYKSRARQYGEELIQKSREAHILKVFGEGELVDLKGFTREDEMVLQKGMLPRVPYIEALRVVKNFSERFVEKDIRPVLTEFFELSNFIDESVEHRYKDSMESLFILALDVRSFEHDLEKIYPGTIGAWVKAIQAESFPEPALKRASGQVRKINQKADIIVQKTLGILDFLTKTHVTIQDDLRARDGDIISNGRQLVQNDREMLLKVDKVMELLVSVIDLLGEYVISRSLMQKAMSSGLKARAQEAASSAEAAGGPEGEPAGDENLV